MISVLPKKGHLLIAEPSILGDLSFNRSVVLLAEHNEEGSVGFILNKPLSYTINDLIPEIDAKFTIYNGGPVEQDNLYFIHSIIRNIYIKIFQHKRFIFMVVLLQDKWFSSCRNNSY